MLGLSMTEVVIILALALLLLGPDQLPSLAKSLGKGLREIRKATDDLKSTFEQEMVRLDETPPTPEAPKPQLQPVAPPAEQLPPASAPPPADPAAARAAARRAAAGLPPASAEPPSLRLVPPEGTVTHEPAAQSAPPVQSASAPDAPAVKDVP
jgi:TatA/E family protein of Tat protein translocase